MVYTAWSLYPSAATKSSIARYLAIHAVSVLLFSSRKFVCLARMAQGICDGINGTLGIRFRADHVPPHPPDVDAQVAGNVDLGKV
jgi:hypothetical protein